MGVHDKFPVQSLDFTELSSMLQGNRNAPFQLRDLPSAEQFDPDAVPEPEPEIQDEAPEPVADLEPTIEELEAKARKMGFTEGYAQGYQQGQAEARTEEDPAALEAMAQMVEARTLFTELARALSDHSETHHTSLRKSVEAAVIALASELAGQQIDFTPESYATKIEELVERVGKSVENTEILLNADDLKVISPCLDHSDALEGCTLRAGEGLARGALDIRSGPNRVCTAFPDAEAAQDPTPEDDT